MTKNSSREPLFHITKRGATVWWKPLFIRAIAIVAGLFIGLCFAAAYTKVNPFKLLGYMFSGAFGTQKRIWNLLQDTALLLMVSIAIVPAFKMKFWNIGADGQTLVGCLASAVAIYYLYDKLPTWALLLVMLLFSLTAGMIWGVIPAIFKAKWNTNETLFTLMMNYVAIQLVSFVLLKWFPSGQNDFAKFFSRYGNMPKLGNPYVLILIFAVVLTVTMHFYLSKTKHGFEVSLVGESVNTSKYVGVNVKKVIIRTMILSGAICGFVGFALVAAKDHAITTTMVGGRGFTAIIVAWLAKFNPAYMALASLMVAFLSRGTSQILSQTGITNSALPNIVTALVFFFIIGCEFFITYSIKFRKKNKDATPANEPPAPETSEPAKEPSSPSSEEETPSLAEAPAEERTPAEEALPTEITEGGEEK
ncbi:MAG: ABC transporter permease [Clostridia bacterium]|nr:ABC transporter permease [Clostridia bacterium]